MNSQAKVRNAVLVAALAAVTATAWATSEPVTVSETLAPNETVVMPDESEVTPGSEAGIAPRIERPAPVAERRAAQPPITIEERRLTLDERIQADVMDRIASMPNISGKIGVESREAVVTLTGYTSTAGQAYRAGREARSIHGVKSVQNEIRPRIGGSV